MGICQNAINVNVNMIINSKCVEKRDYVSSVELMQRKFDNIRQEKKERNKQTRLCAASMTHPV